jgi:hypothetical protein
MTYQFAGFFVAQPMSSPSSLPPTAVWRDVASPFRGVGILLPELIGKVVQPEQVRITAGELGITNSMPWLFIQYDCWGGEVDFVYAMGASSGVPWGPIEESARDRVELAYTKAMAWLGITPEDALNFAPFERGFWGEQ